MKTRFSIRIRGHNLKIKTNVIALFMRNFTLTSSINLLRTINIFLKVAELYSRNEMLSPVRQPAYVNDFDNQIFPLENLVKIKIR